MRHRVNGQVVLLCMPKEGPGPLASHLRSFAQFLSQQGYSRVYLRRHLMLAARFSRWLEHRRIRSRYISSEHVSKYLRYRYRDRRASEGDSAALGHLISFLQAKRVIPSVQISGPTLLAAERCARDYEQYLRQDRALAKATIINYVPFITDFLKDRFGASPVR